LLTEDELNAAVRQHLEREGYEIERYCTTKQRGVDIVAARGNGRLFVEVKGGTSASPTSRRYGKPFNRNQARTHLAVVAYQAMALRQIAQERDAVAIALPKDVVHEECLFSIRGALRQLGVQVFWVDASGAVAREVIE